MSNVLSCICADKKQHVAQQKQTVPLASLKDAIKDTEKPRGFISSLQATHNKGEIALIAEVKKASPSKGIIREDFNATDIAEIYQKAGASCLSVLTDEPYFQGKDKYFKDVHEAVKLPLIRKDFMVDSYQIYESRALGADCILLIMAALNDEEAVDLYELSTGLGMDVLVEVHDHEELSRALSFSPKMIGVNSRNLKTLEVDIQTAHDMIRKIPDNIFKIAESGIKTHQDIQSLLEVGAQGFLVGESLMRQKDIYAATTNLLGTN